MSDKCTLKDPFIMSLFDKFQPNWRNGADISKETKQSIQSYVEKYRSFLNELFEKNTIEDIISIRSIEKSAGRLRREMGLVAKSTRKTCPIRATSDNASVPEKKKSELSDNLRLLQSKYPYISGAIIYVIKNNADLIEWLAKFYKKYPKEDSINEGIESFKYEIPLDNFNEIQKKQVKCMIPGINKEIIFKNPNEIPGIISLYGCSYTIHKKFDSMLLGAAMTMIALEKPEFFEMEAE